jgi:hypothetical protein
VSSLDSKEKLKEEGDSHFKNAKFEEAIKSYTKCLAAISDKVRRQLVFCGSFSFLDSVIRVSVEVLQQSRSVL